MYLLLEGVPPHINGGTLEDWTGGELVDIWTPDGQPDAIGAVVYPPMKEQASVLALMREAREAGIEVMTVRVGATTYQLDAETWTVAISRDGQPVQVVPLEA